MNLIQNYLLVCEDHEGEIIELWKYDSIEDTDHDVCKTRPISPEELIDYLLDPEEQDCINEEFVGDPQVMRGRNLRFLRDMIKSIDDVFLRDMIKSFVGDPQVMRGRNLQFLRDMIKSIEESK